ncbi:riboflavin kinase [Arthrobacter sp. NPDC093128]|jgi:riboflavin kinase/FMN adenylyltransferase|uniref:riboflavin kinase n=1 Tax=Arthrobacter sp. NPDC093128 TaxID=3154979 RepID=UPI00344AE1B8
MSDLFKEECVYVYEGIVEAGDRRGRTLGFPTANIPITAAADIDGVWAGLVETGPETFAIAAVSVGRRRTFYPHDGQRLLEAHLLDFSLNLYGRRLRVHLFERLRGQEAFSTIEALVEQLHLDVGRTREWACGHYPWLTSPASSDSPVGVQA